MILAEDSTPRNRPLNAIVVPGSGEPSLKELITSPV